MPPFERDDEPLEPIDPAEAAVDADASCEIPPDGEADASLSAGTEIGVSSTTGAGSVADTGPAVSDRQFPHRVRAMLVPSVRTVSPAGITTFLLVQKTSSPWRYETWATLGAGSVSTRVFDRSNFAKCSATTGSLSIACTSSSTVDAPPSMIE